MTPPDVERIRAELAAVGVPDDAAQEIAQNLAHLAKCEEIPYHALLAWIHDRPRHGWGPQEFLQWCKRYHLTSGTNLTAPFGAPGPTAQ